MRSDIEGLDQRRPTVWNSDPSLEAVRSVADLCGQAFGLSYEIRDDGKKACSCAPEKPKEGVDRFHIALSEKETLTIHVGLAKAPDNARLEFGPFCNLLSRIEEDGKFVRTHHEGICYFSVDLNAKAHPLSMTRSQALLARLQAINEVSRELKSMLPDREAYQDIEKMYKEMSEVLSPVIPYKPEASEAARRWADETLDLLTGGVSVAIPSPDPVVLDLSLALIAKQALDRNKSVGRLIAPSIDTKDIPIIARKAPGIVAIPVTKIAIGSNVYEIGHDARSILAALEDVGKPVIFTGPYGELQHVFHGGQSGTADPLRPIVRHPPAFPLAELVRFAVSRSADSQGGLSPALGNEIADTVTSVMENRSQKPHSHTLRLLANRAVASCSLGGSFQRDLDSYMTCLASATESLAGLASRPRINRSPVLDERLIQRVVAPAFLTNLSSELFGQDLALAEFASRLRTEALTRPAHQPLRVLTQGPPSSGKTQSAVLLASTLEIPYVNVDAASASSHYEAIASLLGSGRGIVGSYQAGRLQQAAAHHLGAVVEVSDLDHATPSVRSALTDLFLQILENGEGQSATGFMFSCASLLIVFSMNLPGGQDEVVRREFGFKPSPLSRGEIARKVDDELKQIFSAAFLSRVGSPVVFSPIDEPALAVIVERAIGAAIHSALERMNLHAGDIRVEAGTGPCLVAQIDRRAFLLGARVPLERGRSLAADAFVRFMESAPEVAGKTVVAAVSDNGDGLELRVE